MGKSLITASTQRTDFGLIAVSQQMTKLKVVAEQQTNTCPHVISTADRLRSDGYVVTNDNFEGCC